LGREYAVMSKLGPLAIASMLFVGLSGSASAGPIAVTYAISGGAAPDASWSSAIGTPGSGFGGGGSLVVVYTSGSTVIGGSLGSLGSMQVMTVALATAGSALGDPVPAILVGAGAGVLNIGNNGAVTGITAVTASFAAPGVPGISWTGTINMPFAAGGPATINIASGAGSQFGGIINWTVTDVVGTEISRVAIPMPEPGTSALLVMGLVGLAAFGAPKLRR
jgi:hypothetical protein